MRFTASLLLLLAVDLTLNAQTIDEADSLVTGIWQQSLVANLSFAQAAYNDWRSGGENAVAARFSLDGSASRIDENIEQTHVLQVAYGKTKIADQDVRKTDDLLRYTGDFVYLSRKAIRPVLNFDVRTQFDKGYDYDTDPVTIIARFMAPAYITEIIGLAYQPQKWLKLRLGFGAKQTIVVEEHLRESYGVDPNKSLRNEGGIMLIALLQREIADNVVLKSELNAFESFPEAAHPDFRLKNLVQMQVNRYLNATLEVELLYDKDAWEGLQLRQTFGLGVSATIL